MYIKLRKVFVHTSLNHPVLSKITLQNSNAYNNNFNYEQLTSCQHLGNVKLQFNTWLTRTIKVLRYPINLTSDNFEIERFL